MIIYKIFKFKKKITFNLLKKILLKVKKQNKF